MLLPNTERNPGVPLQADWFDHVAVNTQAAERRAATLTTRRTVKKAWQAAWLVNAVRCIDLTTLSGDDTEHRVERLCAKARRPLGGSHHGRAGDRPADDRGDLRLSDDGFGGGARAAGIGDSGRVGRDRDFRRG